MTITEQPRSSIYTGAVARSAVDHHNTHLDERDAAALARFVAAYDYQAGPRVGDFVRFPDGVLRRVAHLWDAYTYDGEDRPATVQTADGGSFHLSETGASFSGGLHPGVPLDTIRRSEGSKLGRVWIWHHGRATAHNGIDVLVRFRLYTCAVTA